MADISSIILPDGNSYNLKDPVARLMTALPFMISKQPEPCGVEGTGSDISFDIELAGGSGNYTYEWQFLTNGDWAKSDQESANDQHFAVTDIGNAWIYAKVRCVVSDGTTTLISNVVYVYLNSEDDFINGNAISEGNYGVCDTGAGTAAKVVYIKGFTLRVGVVIHVKFTNANTHATPTLNVNRSGAKPMRQYGTTKMSSTSATTGWYAGAVICLTYDGSGWIRDQGFNTNTTYSGMSVAEYEDGTSTTARLITPANLKNAIDYHAPDASCIDVTTPSFNSLPITFYSSYITANHKVIGNAAHLSYPKAGDRDWQFSFADGSLTISGTFHGNTATTATMSIYVPKRTITLSATQ